MTLSARSIAEEHLYIRLHPCRCGQQVDVSTLAHASAIASDRTIISVFSGKCAACGSSLRYEFEVPDDAPRGRVSLGGAVPSAIIDPGTFYIASEQCAQQGDLELAIACLQEVLKFIPPGEDKVPASCFRGAASARVALERPEQFTRRVIEARIAALREDRVTGEA